jgi:hypothetical protein
VLQIAKLLRAYGSSAAVRTIAAAITTATAAPQTTVPLNNVAILFLS